jgi:predicted Holliday junction resolvase-like endonuclease
VLTAILVLLLVGVTLFLLFLLYQYVSLKSAMETRAREQFVQWRDNEMENIQRQYEEIAQREADTRLTQWKQESTETIRKDAIEKSRAVTLGKVTEHVVPFLPGFQHNPKDARFIGTPVDFIIFDGLDAGEVQQITFVEVKTGSSSLSKRERQIREAVKQQRVVWEELRIPTTSSQNQLMAESTETCSLPLPKTCAQCGKENREQVFFCGYCGAQLP